MATRQLKLFSWNVNGFRAVRSKTVDDGKPLFDNFLARHDPDILCLQEIKMTADPAGDLTLPYPYQFFNSAAKPGYSGTALLSRVKPLSLVADFPGEHLREGRVITAEFSGCYVVCAYVPNAQAELTRLDYRLRWDADFHAHLTALAAKKPVFICGDLNCALQEIDLENPAQNRRSAGFTNEERASLSALLQRGFRDTFRERNPNATKRYTWWSYRMRARERNVGWRIDYWLATQALDDAWDAPAIHADVTGSDHCPVSLHADSALF